MEVRHNQSIDRSYSRSQAVSVSLITTGTSFSFSWKTTESLTGPICPAYWTLMQ
jgi:CRISPR/Cas system CSM-associated protein Csm3 (group 7 of RAMP superfamily)